MGKRNAKKNKKTQILKNKTPIGICIKSTLQNEPTILQKNEQINDEQVLNLISIEQNINANLNEKTEPNTVEKFKIIENYMDNLPQKEKHIPVIIEDYILHLPIEIDVNKVADAIDTIDTIGTIDTIENTATNEMTTPTTSYYGTCTIF